MSIGQLHDQYGINIFPGELSACVLGLLVVLNQAGIHYRPCLLQVLGDTVDSRDRLGAHFGIFVPFVL